MRANAMRGPASATIIPLQDGEFSTQFLRRISHRRDSQGIQLVEESSYRQSGHAGSLSQAQNIGFIQTNRQGHRHTVLQQAIVQRDGDEYRAAVLGHHRELAGLGVGSARRYVLEDRER